MMSYEAKCDGILLCRIKGWGSCWGLYPLDGCESLMPGSSSSCISFLSGFKLHFIIIAVLILMDLNSRNCIRVILGLWSTSCSFLVLGIEVMIRTCVFFSVAKFLNGLNYISNFVHICYYFWDFVASKYGMRHYSSIHW